MKEMENEKKKANVTDFFGAVMRWMLVLLLTVSGFACLFAAAKGVQIDALALQPAADMPVVPTPVAETQNGTDPEAMETTVAQEECKHNWEDGVCTKCGEACSHPMHDQFTHVCLQCGQLVMHHFVSGRCSVCAAIPNFEYGYLPDEYYEPCDEQGTVIDWEYTTQLYGRRDVVSRDATIYLPYGYDPAQKYNVLVLVHGLGGTSRDMISRVVSYDGHDYQLCNVYDHMIQKKECAPFIGVGISTRAGGEVWYDPLARELKEVILPYIVDTYSTYAEDSSIESIIAARQHFGMSGLSMGSMYTYNAGMSLALDVFGNFAPFGGNDIPGSVARQMNSSRFADYPIYCFISGSGISEGGQFDQLIGYQTIYQSTDRLQSGKNSFYVRPEGGHEWKVWNTEMYNALQVLFQDIDDDLK